MLVSSPLKSNEIELNSKDENKLTVQQHSCSDWHILKNWKNRLFMVIFFLLFQNCASMWSPYRGETLRLAQILAFFVASVASKQMKTQDWNIKSHKTRVWLFSCVTLHVWLVSGMCYQMTTQTARLRWCIVTQIAYLFYFLHCAF